MTDQHGSSLERILRDFERRLQKLEQAQRVIPGIQFPKASDPGALTATPGSSDDTIVDVGASFNQTTLNNNFRDLVTKINQYRVNFQNADLMS